MTLNDMPELENVLAITIRKLNQVSIPWLLGGSCSLLLQDVKLAKPPRDIDIYADAGEFSCCINRWPPWQWMYLIWTRKGSIPQP